MTITRHAYKRGKQRLGLNAKALERMVETALDEGTPHKDTKGAFKRYLNGLYLQYKQANNIRVYGQHIYLFRRDRLITIYHVPKEFIRHLNLN